MPVWIVLPLMAFLAAGVFVALVLLPRWVEEHGPLIVKSEANESASPERRSAERPQVEAPTAAGQGAGLGADLPREAPDPAVLKTPPKTPPKTPSETSPETPPESQFAEPAVSRTDPSDPAFLSAMSDALAALDRDDWPAAREALAKAQVLRPAAPEIADARLRIETGERRERIAALREQAEEHEAAERWSEAAAAYQAVLDLDPTVAFARNGKTRTSERAGLAAALAYHRDHPQRLSSSDVLDEVADLVAHAREIEAAGPRHREQVEALSRLVDAWSQPVTARLISDRQTRVTVYRVGPLGAFGEHVLELRPGTYTVVGHREGYRDVRRDLVIRPGRPPEPLSVICDEKI